MDKFIFISILILVLTTTPTNGVKGDSRPERDLSIIESVALPAFHAFSNIFRKSAGFHHGSDTDFNIYSVKISGGNNFKTGHGEVVETSKKRRDVSINIDTVNIENSKIFEQKAPNSETTEEEDSSEENSSKEESTEEESSENSIEENPSLSQKPSGKPRRSKRKAKSTIVKHEITTTINVQTTTPIAMERKKRAASPCFGRKRMSAGGDGTGGDEGVDGEAEQLRRSKYSRQRGRRQLPDNIIPESTNPLDTSVQGENKFEQFVNKMMETASNVVQKFKEVFSNN